MQLTDSPSEAEDWTELFGLDWEANDKLLRAGGHTVLPNACPLGFQDCQCVLSGRELLMTSQDYLSLGRLAGQLQLTGHSDATAELILRAR